MVAFRKQSQHEQQKMYKCSQRIIKYKVLRKKINYKFEL
jgi:hypothetical protein